MDSDDILEATRVFWNDLVTGDFQNIEDLVAPDCRIQDQFGDQGRGINGSEKCILKLKELQTKITKARIDTTIKCIKQMRNNTQIRFFISGKVAFMNISIGMALEWLCGIIVGFVIIKNAEEVTFFKDDTILSVKAPPIVVPIAQSPSPPLQNTAIESPPLDTSRNDTTDVKSTSFETKGDDGKWYLGKFVGRKKSSDQGSGNDSDIAVRLRQTSMQSDNGLQGQAPEQRNYLDSNPILSFGRVLEPPFLVPRPPPIPPTVSVTVVGCQYLKSRLNRLIPRPINSYVRVSVNNRTQQTEIASHTANPVYNSSNGKNKFIFELSNMSEQQLSMCTIDIQVMDQHLLDEDLLAEVRVPLVYIKCQTAGSQSLGNLLTLPLNILERRLGKGFRQSNHVVTDNEVPSLQLYVSKVDIMQWWVLEELRLRDEAMELQLRMQELKRIEQKEEQARRDRLQREAQAGAGAGAGAGRRRPPSKGQEKGKSRQKDNQPSSEAGSQPQGVGDAAMGDASCPDLVIVSSSSTSHWVDDADAKVCAKYGTACRALLYCP